MQLLRKAESGRICIIYTETPVIKMIYIAKRWGCQMILHKVDGSNIRATMTFQEKSL